MIAFQLIILIKTFRVRGRRFYGVTAAIPFSISNSLTYVITRSERDHAGMMVDAEKGAFRGPSV
jgi:hypothetical protein